MKLAEALILRADAQARIAQLRDRLAKNAKIQEGDQPVEEPRALLQDLERTLKELTTLIKRINRTNAQTRFDARRTLTDVLAERDTLALERSVMVDLVNAATVSVNRFTRSEVRYLVTFNVTEIQKRVDDLARQYREMDTRIQELNWLTDLVD